MPPSARSYLIAYVLDSGSVTAAGLHSHIDAVVAEAITALDLDAVVAEGVAKALTTLDLIGNREIAKILGVGIQRAWQLAEEHPDFPEPILRTKSGRLYTRESIIAFGASRERGPYRRDLALLQRKKQE